MMERQQALSSRLAAFTAALILLPVLSAGQESRVSLTEKLSSVTDEYTLEGLLPLMPQAVADGSKNLCGT
jgi:hypothetical protein